MKAPGFWAGFVAGIAAAAWVERNQSRQLNTYIVQQAEVDPEAIKDAIKDAQTFEQGAS